MMKTKKNKGIIQGIGNDLIEISRLEKVIAAHGKRFLDRIFTQREQNYCNKFKDKDLHFSGRFAAKEAVSKALGLGFGARLSWLDIEILNDSRGKPEVFLSPSLLLHLGESTSLLVSISHCKHFASAVALWTI